MQMIDYFKSLLLWYFRRPEWVKTGYQVVGKRSICISNQYYDLIDITYSHNQGYVRSARVIRIP